MNGILALAGSGEYLERMAPVDRLLLSRIPGEPRVACLPTAAAPDGRAVFDDWAERGVAHFTRLGARAEAVLIATRRDADDESLAARIHSANFIYLSGGKPDYLYDTLNGTRAFAALTDLLERGGVVAGCSAGAMIWGEVIPNFPTVLPLKKVFNRLPKAVIVPHYDEFGQQWGGMIKAVIGNRLLVGIDGFTALVCANGAYTVAGVGAVTVWDKRSKVRYTDGQTVPING